MIAPSTAPRKKSSASKTQVLNMYRLAQAIISSGRSARFDQVLGGAGELIIDSAGNLKVHYVYLSGMNSSNQIVWKFSPQGELLKGTHAPYIGGEECDKDFEPEIWDRMDPGYAKEIITSLCRTHPGLEAVITTTQDQTRQAVEGALGNL